MSAIRLVYLYCDGGEQCPRDGDEQQVPLKVDPLPYESARVQRQQAKAAGWTFRKGQDYCIECSQRLRAIDSSAKAP